MKILGLIVLALMCSIATQADILPDKPEPQVHHNPFTVPFRETANTFKDVATFKDKKFSVAAFTYVGAYGADMISTVVVWDKCSKLPQLQCSEGGGFFNGTRDAGRLAAAWGGIAVANIVISYEWKKHIKNRYIHDLWAAGMVYQGSQHVYGSVGNVRDARTVDSMLGSR